MSINVLRDLHPSLPLTRCRLQLLLLQLLLPLLLLPRRPLHRPVDKKVSGLAVKTVSSVWLNSHFRGQLLRFDKSETALNLKKPRRRRRRHLPLLLPLQYR